MSTLLNPKRTIAELKQLRAFTVNATGELYVYCCHVNLPTEFEHDSHLAREAESLPYPLNR